jgi:hypothetical protein
VIKRIGLLVLVALIAVMMLVVTAAPVFADSYRGKTPGNGDTKGNKYTFANGNQTIKTYDNKCDGPRGLCNG